MSEANLRINDRKCKLFVYFKKGLDFFLFFIYDVYVKYFCSKKGATHFQFNTVVTTYRRVMEVALELDCNTESLLVAKRSVSIPD